MTSSVERLKPDGSSVGRSAAKWGLSNSFERLIKQYRLEENAHELEGKLIREFQRKAHHFVPQTPRRSDTLEWLAMMRHYGAPTRLLDRSYSFFVATYFACESAKDECAVWVLDARWCRQQAKLHLQQRQLLRPDEEAKEADSVYDPLYVDGSRRSMRRFRELLMRKAGAVPLVYPVNPFRLNERLTIQQGVFTCQGDISRGPVARGPVPVELRLLRLGQHVEPEPEILLVGEPVQRRGVAVDRGLDLEVGVLPRGGLEIHDDEAALGVPLEAIEAPDEIPVEHSPVA